jgi:para-aminobenzoate synthetase/4-amino-4-deoxychorismate lyase
MIAAPMPERAALTPEPRPDPSHGVFETLLAVRGRPVELDAHLARLGASLRALYGLETPAEVRDMLLRESHAGALGRVRVTVSPGRDGSLEALALGSAVDPGCVFPDRTRGASLATTVTEAGLGAHKWADRRSLHLAEAVSPGSVPLILAAGGEVLEASRANLFAVIDGALVTPPLDGRILPGITRARVIEVAAEAGVGVREEPLEMEQLLSADEVFLTGSVRGVEPVASIDDNRVSPGERLTRSLAAALRERWLGR